MANTSTLLARGLGRRAYRDLRPLHLAVSETLAAYPTLDPADVRSGWHAERQEQREEAGYEAGAIGGGL